MNIIRRRVSALAISAAALFGGGVSVTGCTLAEQLGCALGETATGGTWSQCNQIENTGYQQRATHWCFDGAFNTPIVGPWVRYNTWVSVAHSCPWGSYKNNVNTDIVLYP